MDSNVPFRWDLKRVEQLGSLLRGEQAASYIGFMDDVRECCAKILSMTKDSDLVFVGRSPESLYDYLRGISEHTSFEKRIHMLNLSLRNESLTDLVKMHNKFKSIKEYFYYLKLDPKSLLKRRNPVMFVDVVSGGYTYENLFKIIKIWSKKEHLNFNDVKLKIRFLGLTWKVHSARYADRWWQDFDWPRELKSGAVKNISIDGQFWDYIGNKQKKVENSYHSKYWGDDGFSKPNHLKGRLEALRLAYQIYKIAKQKNEQLKLHKLLSNRQAMKDAWLRSFNLEIKNK